MPGGGNATLIEQKLTISRPDVRSSWDRAPDNYDNAIAGLKDGPSFPFWTNQIKIFGCINTSTILIACQCFTLFM